MKFKKNEGNLDRIIRLIMAVLVMLLAVFWAGGVLQIALYVVGGILLFTGISGFCGLYTLLGINTRR